MSSPSIAPNTRPPENRLFCEPTGEKARSRFIQPSLAREGILVDTGVYHGPRKSPVPAVVSGESLPFAFFWTPTYFLGLPLFEPRKAAGLLSWLPRQTYAQCLCLFNELPKKKPVSYAFVAIGLSPNIAWRGEILLCMTSPPELEEGNSLLGCSLPSWQAVGNLERNPLLSPRLQRGFSLFGVLLTQVGNHRHERNEHPMDLSGAPQKAQPPICSSPLKKSIKRMSSGNRFQLQNQPVKNAIIFLSNWKKARHCLEMSVLTTFPWDRSGSTPKD